MTALRILAGAAFLTGLIAGFASEPPSTGPATEKRFPPLQLPAGFKATLFACDPLIEYSSAIAAGPRPNSLFAGVDYLTGLGTDIVRRDEIRLLEDTNGDGYADRSTVFAAGFNSVQGLAYYDGTLFVMHAPFLTALRDTDGDGKADERHDLLSGLGLAPEKNPPRLHCANGVVPGHDGWLYLALGDHGCDVKRPEGDHLILEGGGILRCRPDGRGLHVFATGLRNIYDIVLDEDLNVFVRDNENDGGTYMVRVCHSFFGADHGYPYLYEERPAEALPPLADLGRGSSAGGVCYLETGFPSAYRGNLFFCEWGRAVVRYEPRPAGSAFAPLKEVTFASGAANDPYGFRPTDLVVQPDGALLVSDWADGQRARRGRGRIYRITYEGRETRGEGREKKGARREPRRATPDLKQMTARLNSESASERTEAQAALVRSGRNGNGVLRAELDKRSLSVRGRLHAVWILARGLKAEALDDLMALARTDADPRVQAQAVRAIADLADPVLVRHRLDAGPGDAKLASRLAAMAPGRDPRVLREIVVALARLQWQETPRWLSRNPMKSDPSLEHAAMQAIRWSRNWPAALELLDSGSDSLRMLALRALAGQYDPAVVDGLLARLRGESDPGRRLAYTDTLSRLYKKPGPWTYWGYRPGPRPPHSRAWEGTPAIERALNKILADPDRPLRLELLRRLRRENIPIQLASLERWLADDHDPDRAATVLETLGNYPPGEVRADLRGVVRDSAHSVRNRLTALAAYAAGLDAANEKGILELATAVEDGPIMAAALRHIRARPKLRATSLLLEKAQSADAEVRAEAVETLTAFHVVKTAGLIAHLLKDEDIRVRRAGARAAGVFKVQTAVPALLAMARAADPDLRQASLDALRLLKERRAVPPATEALSDRATQVTGLRLLEELGGPEQINAVLAAAQANPSAEVLPRACRVLTAWAAQTSRQREMYDKLAELQGASGLLVLWHVAEGTTPDPASLKPQELSSVPKDRGKPAGNGLAWRVTFAAGPEGRVHLATSRTGGNSSLWLACTDLDVAQITTAQFLASASSALRIWLDGKSVFQRDRARPLVADAELFDVTLSPGRHRLLVQVAADEWPATEFHVRFRRKTNKQEHEQLTQAALTRAGNVDRGRQLFFNVAKSSCLKCHRLKDQGERIGPDLTGVGNRFGRIHIIESILEPSRWIAPGYETIAIELADGRIVTGTRVAESTDTLTLGDRDGKQHVLRRNQIESRRTHPVSTMPEGLERQLTTQEFVDLVTFLARQK